MVQPQSPTATLNFCPSQISRLHLTLKARQSHVRFGNPPTAKAAVEHGIAILVKVMAFRVPGFLFTSTARKARTRDSSIRRFESCRPANSVARALISAQNTSKTSNLAQEKDSIPLPPSTSPHNSLPSFLNHAAVTSLSPSSSVYIGTHYEYTVLSALARLGFSLTRIGGRSDNGIDLVGTWQLPLPHLPFPIRVVLSCKTSSSKSPGSPAWVRELEGGFGGAPPGWRSNDVMGFVVTTGVATKGVRDAVRRSGKKMGFMSVNAGGVIEQLLWNGEIEAVVGDGLGIGIRYLGKGGRECVLMWRGEELEDHE